MVGSARPDLRLRKPSDLAFDISVVAVMVLVIVVTLYPLYFVVIASISNQFLVGNGEVILYPKGITFSGYAKIFEDHRILLGYRNTLVYTAAGTLINLVVTIPAAYALSRRDFLLRKPLMFFFIFTMFFNGGLIPTYITIRSLHLVNTIWVMLIPFCLNVFYLIIARTYFETNVPVELFDAARMDGCTNTAFFIWIVLPLSKAILAVIGLYYAVLHWNEFFMALIYIRDQSLYPLQLILRDILVRNQVMSGAVDSGAAAVQMADLIKYGVIIIAILPMIVVYPFVQRYFVKGALVGAIKG